MHNVNDFPAEMIFDKELTEEELELIRREYKKIKSIDKMSMDSISYQLFLSNNKNIYLPKDALIYSTNSSLENLNIISEEGILASEFLGVKNDDGTYYCSPFFKLKCDTPLTFYDSTFKSTDNTVFGDFNDKIAFVINPTSKIGGLLYYDLLDPKFDNNPIVKNIISSDIKDKYTNNMHNPALILVGLPKNAISGVIVGDKLLLDIDKINEIKRLFPNSYIISRKGILIRDRSNVIKVDDFENVSYNYAKENINNFLLQEENNKLKSEIKNILGKIKNNTSYFEQAKIYKDLGYKIPKGLLNKLNSKELSELK